MIFRFPAAAARAALLSFTLLSLALPGARGQAPPAPAPLPVLRPSALTLSGPYSRANLSIYLIHGKDAAAGKTFLTLQEALEQKKVVVYETGNVNQLSAENRSNDLVFIQSGDIVKGGQQDRAVQFDMILPPHSGKVPLSSFCVESGRWTARPGEAGGCFAASSAALPTPSLKMAAQAEGDQSMVWAKVSQAQEKLARAVAKPVASPLSSTSLQLTLENKEVGKAVRDRSASLEKIVNGKPDVVGYACAINGKVATADVYASHALFLKLWPKLLQGSAIASLTEYDATKRAAAAPPPQTVRDFLSRADDSRPSRQSINGRARDVRQEASDSVKFGCEDTAAPGRFVHMNYVTK